MNNSTNSDFNIVSVFFIVYNECKGVLVMDAYEAIRNAIIEGVYEPGKRLTEEHLATLLEISRTPIREALKKLETEGLVIPLKRGVSVRTYSHDDIRHIYDLRALLEGYAAHQAALFCTPDELAVLQKVNESYKEIVIRGRRSELNSDALKEIVKLNNIFHETVMQASKNAHIHFLMSKVFVLPLVFRSFYWYQIEEIEQSLEFHQTVFQAIQQKESERAKSAMVEHIYKGRDHVLRHLPADYLSKSENS